jgi:hypothetical protein
MACRQIPGCFNENADYIRGTKGALIISGDSLRIVGENPWVCDTETPVRDMYEQEHVELFESIRNGSAKNDGEWMCHSTLLALMGRMSAYSGKRLTWKQLLASKEDLAPDDLKWDDSFTPHELAVPGKYKLL